MLVFVEESLTNSDDGLVSVTAHVTWMDPESPNGVLIAQSVTIRSVGGASVFSDNSVGVGMNSVITVVDVQGGELYSATVAVSNGAGSSEANTSLVMAPQGGECAI